LLLGPPSSGKSTVILNEVRALLRRGGASFRLVVPTSTMATHLRHLLAREGHAVRPRAIVTLAAFLEELDPEARAAPPAVLERLTARALEETRPAAFENFTGSTGFAAALAGTIEDLANAGCDSLQWAGMINMGAASGPVAQAVGAVYENVEQRLARAGFMLRAAQLAHAVAALRGRPPRHLRRIFWDGFFTFARAEVELVTALAAHAETWVALPEWPGARTAIEVLARSGFRAEHPGAVRKPPSVACFSAPSAEDEAEEIALRLLEESSAGRPWREMGVILRGAQPYAPLLRATFARFGIPARFYFARPLLSHPAARLIAGAVEALLSGWDHEVTLACLVSPASISGQSPAAGEFENRVRERLPAKGLDGLRIAARGLDGGAPLRRAISILAEADAWSGGTLPPELWAARMADFESLVAPPDAPEPFGAADALRWRDRAAALRTVREALRHAARSMPAGAVPLAEYWREALPILAAWNLHPSDYRRDAVAVMDVYEARQWELPAVFLCGLLEGEFPRTAAPDPILGEETRLRLIHAGLPLRTRAGREEEEQFLFRFALTRASEKLILSWPTAGDDAEPTLRSFALDSLPPGFEIPAAPLSARRAAVRASRPVPPLPPPSIQDAGLLDELRRRHASLRATGVETFLQCPFRFFAVGTLEVEPVPPPPALRLNPLVEGVVVHSVIAAWHRGEGELLQLFERAWNEALRHHRIPDGYRSEFSRALIERSLRFYEQKASLPPGWETRVEEPVRLRVEGATIEGRIDRYDLSPLGECAVYDFKFTGKSRLREREKKQAQGLSVQGGLYSTALKEMGLKPVSFRYVGLRGDTNWGAEVTGAELAILMDDAVRIASEAVFRIQQGDISVRPADAEQCRYCDFRSACRVAEAAVAEAAAE
jgi:ATP-dependent helicase/DNAse subunit B